MKSTGMVRNVDNLDRIVIPKELRTTLNIDPKNSLEIFVDNEMIVLKKYAAEQSPSDVSIVRHVDELGRIVIPKEICKVLDIEPKEALEIFVDDEKIILGKYEPSCIFCKEAFDTIRYKNRIICRKCLAELAKLV